LSGQIFSVYIAVLPNMLEERIFVINLSLS